MTAACMMVKREAFEKVGGLSEELQVAFNDIDFCMKLRQAGYLIVYNPYAELYHYDPNPETGRYSGESGKIQSGDCYV